MESQIEPRLIIDIAALAFWTDVQKKSYGETSGYVMDRKYSVIWDIEDLKNYLNLLQVNINTDNTDTALKLIYDMVNKYLTEETSEERNIDGSIYLDDFDICRTPDFNKFDLLKQLENDTIIDDKKVKIKGDLPPIIGELLIRSPLPAIVLLKTRNIPSAILVKDTKKALGFKKNLVFYIRGVGELPSNKWSYVIGASGVFSIPTSSTNDKIWKQIIPNANYFSESITLFRS